MSRKGIEVYLEDFSPSERRSISEEICRAAAADDNGEWALNLPHALFE